MANLQEILQFCQQQLQVLSIKDYCPNGLQVQGRQQVKKIVSGVTASQALIDAAIAAKADALLVHHGYFWKGENETVVGIKHQRLKALLTHDMNLLAYHLPLDVHPQWGNNVQLAQLLDWQITGDLQPQAQPSIGLCGELRRAMTPQQFGEQLQTKLKREPLWIDGANGEIKTLAWCTGAAQGYIEDAIAAGVDAFVSGEISEQTVHIAREMGIHYFAAGHHATERYGVQALGEALASEFALEHEFIDIDSPV